jgi:ApaG protein
LWRCGAVLLWQWLGGRYNAALSWRRRLREPSVAASGDSTMFTAITSGIAVVVEPSFLPADSDPAESRYVWAYRVTISNEGPVTVQLLSRRWLITDGNGITREVVGRGVVGQQPTILPGGVFEYTSGCPLTTASGIMVGTYRMVAENGDTFEVAIPAFSLDVPDAGRVLN